MTALAELRTTTNYLSRSQSSANRRLNQFFNTWLREVSAFATTPPVFTFTVDAVGASENDESITFASIQKDGSATTEAETIFKDDVLAFDIGGGVYVVAVCSDDTVIAGGATDFTIPVYPLEGDVTASLAATSYLLKPYLSDTTGSGTDESGTEATALNRGSALIPAKATVQRDISMSLDGPALANDPGLLEIYRPSLKAARFWAQVRYDVGYNYTDGNPSYGTGLDCVEGPVIVSTKGANLGRNEFQQTSFSAMFDGQIGPYKVLGLPDAAYVGLAAQSLRLAS